MRFDVLLTLFRASLQIKYKASNINKIYCKNEPAFSIVKTYAVIPIPSCTIIYTVRVHLCFLETLFFQGAFLLA